VDSFELKHCFTFPKLAAFLACGAGARVGSAKLKKTKEEMICHSLPHLSRQSAAVPLSETAGVTE
jgi:hypothetical protein